MKVGLFLPVIGGADAAGLRDFLMTAARTAEEARFHSLWVPEHVVLFDHIESRYPYSPDGSWPVPPGLGMVEPFTALAFAAAVTSRIRLGTGVCLVPQRPPIYTAKQVADCDVLSGGRLDFGVGIGWLREEFEALDVEFEGRATRTREYLAAMKSLWMDDVSQHQGNLLKIPPLRMFPKPVQKPHPPLWFGAHHPAALRRAVELGDGFMGAGSVSTATFADEVKLLRGLLESAGRDPATFGIGKRVYIAVDRDRDRAGARLAEWFGAFYGRPELAAQVAVWGDVDTCRAGLARVVEGGARLLMLNPVFDELEHLEIFARDLAPALGR